MNEKIEITIKHENQNTREYGYGLYINAYVKQGNFDAGLLGSVMVSKNATADEIKKAEKLARSRARSAFVKMFS